MKILRAAAVATLGLGLLTGLAYPLFVTAVCQLLFPKAANGSLVVSSDGRLLGSALIGQPFHGPGFFWPRPSAAGTGYDPQASGPSNLGPTSRKLADSFKAEAARGRGDVPEGPLPADRLTGSGSGLDPDISVENAQGQAPRIARTRGIDLDVVVTVIDAHEQGRSLGLFGEPRVNVLALNQALELLER